MDKGITAYIQKSLDDIERRYDVKILHAVESGSRAWGFESEDSDYDVRFIYVRCKDDYLTLVPKRDVIEWQLDDVMDINGWDIKKTLKLIQNNNVTPYEWSVSPIVYRTTEAWTRVARFAHEQYDLRTMFAHYLSIAKDQYAKNISSQSRVYLKKYLYVLRPLFAAMWIADRGEKPPIVFEKLSVACSETALQEIIAQIIHNKKRSKERDTCDRFEELDRYICLELEKLERRSTKVDAQTRRDESAWDRIFRATIPS